MDGILVVFEIVCGFLRCIKRKKEIGPVLRVAQHCQILSTLSFLEFLKGYIAVFMFTLWALLNISKQRLLTMCTHHSSNRMKMCQGVPL